MVYYLKKLYTFKVNGTQYLDFKGMDVKESKFPKNVVKMLFGWKKNQKLGIGLFSDDPSNVTLQNYRRMPRIVELEGLKLLEFSEEKQLLLEQILNTSTVFAGTRS